MGRAEAISFALACLLFFVPALFLFSANTSDSVPLGIYMRSFGPIEEGSYVRIENPLQDGVFGVQAGDRILKRVSEVSGDGMVTLEGDSEMAFDSRYYGPISTEYIRDSWRPVLVQRRD